MRARTPGLIPTLVAAQLAAVATVVDADNSFPQLVKAWSEPTLAAPSVRIEGLRLGIGHLTLTLKTGSAAPVAAGGEVVGLYFRGEGSLEYASSDPIEFPVMAYDVEHATRLKATRDGDRLVINDAFKELLWLAAGAELPALSPAHRGPPVVPLGDDFASHLKKFEKVSVTPVCHQFPARVLNGDGGPLVRAELSGGADDLLYVLDAPERKSEALYALHKSKWITGQTDAALLSDQPIGHGRREQVAPRFVLGDVDLAVTASSGKDLALTATETFTAVSGRVGVLLLHLYDTTFTRDTLEERHLHVKAITDEAGSAVPFDHRKGELAVGLAAPLGTGASVRLRFELEGDILYRPRGDSYWELGMEPWFPQPDLASQYYKVHALVKVKKSFVPFAPGKTVRRAEEGEYNVLETRIDKPIQFMVVLAGKYSYEEDTKNGLTVRVASYAGRSVNLRRLIDVSRGMIGFYKWFLGPFPFDEFNIVEINSWGFGQAPPAFIFITQEAFTPLRPKPNRLTGDINELIAHEIAHQYWGHAVKFPSAEEKWLGESFAEMSAALLLREIDGESDFDGVTKRWRAHAEAATALAPIPLANRIRNDSDMRAASIAAMSLLYDKGPLLLNSIRLEIGDAAFLRFLHACQVKSAWEFGNTAMVESVLESVTQKDWKPFFDAYYWGTAMPPK